MPKRELEDPATDRPNEGPVTDCSQSEKNELEENLTDPTKKSQRRCDSKRRYYEQRRGAEGAVNEMNPEKMDEPIKKMKKDAILNERPDTGRPKWGPVTGIFRSEM